MHCARPKGVRRRSPCQPHHQPPHDQRRSPINQHSRPASRPATPPATHFTHHLAYSPLPLYPTRPIFPPIAPAARRRRAFTVCFDFGPRRFTRIAPTTTPSTSASASALWSALHHRRAACAHRQRHSTAIIGSPFHPADPAESPPSAVFTMSKRAPRPSHERAATSPRLLHPNARPRAPP
jgi:hypothetical protein